MKKLFCFTLSLIFLLSTTSVFADNHKNYWAPPGLAKKEELPKGLEKKLETFRNQLWNKEEMKEFFKALEKFLKDYDYDLDDYYDNDDNDNNDNNTAETNDYYGTFEEIDNNNLKIHVSDELKIFDINSDVTVLFNNKEGSLSDLKKDDILGIHLDDDDDVDYIRVYRDLTQLEYTGDVQYLEEDDDLLVLEINNKYIAFELDSDVDVKFDGSTGDLSQVRKGDTVTITLNSKEEVDLLDVDRSVSYRTYKGTVIEPYTNGSFKLIEDDDRKHSFQVSSNFKVQFKDKEENISNIKIGDPIEVTINRDHDVADIKIDRDYEENIVTGKFVRIYENTSSNYDDNIVIETNKQSLIYYLDNTVDVYINGDKEDISDLKKDDEIRLELESNKVEVIKAYR